MPFVCIECCMCQERTQLGRDDSDCDCDVDVPTTRVWPWWVELCQLPVILSPLRCPFPPPPFQLFSAYPIEFLTPKLPHLIFRSVQQLATLFHNHNPSIFCFLFFVLLPTASNNWKYAAYYLPFFHFSFAFPFCFNSFRNFQSEKPT